MADTGSTKIEVRRREAGSSRETRRLRRGGRIPGVLYGLGGDPVAFDADERELRNALMHRGAVLDLVMDGSGEPVVLKEAQRHPVRGDLVHVDLVRVDLNKPIEAQVAIHLTGQEDSPGVREGGVLEHPTREITIEALPADVPEYLELSVAEMQINDRLTTEAVVLPSGVQLISDLEEVIASVSPPRVEEEPEVEVETELVGEDGEPIEAADGEDADESDSDSGSDGDND
jgi:large subunit ribosomal protein L25